MRLFRALSYRSFALLWSGQSVSSLGDAIYGIALAWFVLEQTGSATTLGPALGALIIGLWSTASAFLLDGISFFVSAGCLLALARLPALHKLGTRSSSPVQDLREGVGTVLRSPWLWITIAIASFLNITEAGPRNVVLPFLIKQTLHAGVGAFELVNSLWAAGFLLSSAWLGRSIHLRRRGVLGYGGWLIGGLMTLAMGLPITLAGVCVAIFVLGASIAVFDLVWTNSLQELVPRDLLGRVSSIDALGSFALIPVGFGVAGFAADRMGPAMVFVVGGAVTAAGVGLGLLHPAIRGLD